MMKNFLINNNSTIKQALRKLSECGEKCLIVVNKNNLLQGTLSDGDLRKSIVNNKWNSIKFSNPINLIQYWELEEKSHSISCIVLKVTLF